MFLLDRWEVSPFCVVVIKVAARSRPAKGWPCLMKTDEAEIKCLPTLRDSFITVSPRAIEHLGLELSFNRPCLTAPWWHTAAFQAHEHFHIYLSFSIIRCRLRIALTDRITVYISMCIQSHPLGSFKLEWGFNCKKKKERKWSDLEEPLANLAIFSCTPMLTHVGSTAIRSWISSVEGPCSHLAAHLACVA